MVRIDPAKYSAAADAFDGISQQAMTYAIDARGTLSGYDGMAGTDPGGESFAEAYDQMATAALQVLYDIGVATRGLDRALMATGGTHAQANANAEGIVYDAASAFVLRPEIAETTVAPPPSAFGGRPDTMVQGLDSAAAWVWDQVLNFIGTLFPDGDPEKLEEAGRSWASILGDIRSLRTDIRLADNSLSGIESGELSSINTKVNDFADGLTTFLSSDDGIGAIDDICKEYATSIRDTLEETRQMIAQLVIEVVAGAGISFALSFVTFGAAGVIGGGAIAARITFVAGRIASLVSKCVGTASRLAIRLRAIVAGMRAAGTAFPKLTRVGIELVSGTTSAVLAETVQGGDANYLAAFTSGLAGGTITSAITAPFGRHGSKFLVQALANGSGGAGGTVVDLAVRGEAITGSSVALGAGLGVGMSARLPGRRGPASASGGDGGSANVMDYDGPSGTGDAATGSSVDGAAPRAEFDGPSGQGGDSGGGGGDGGGASANHGDAPAATDIVVTPEGGGSDGTPSPVSDAPAGSGDTAPTPDGGTSAPEAPAGNGNTAGDGAPTGHGDGAPAADGAPSNQGGGSPVPHGDGSPSGVGDGNPVAGGNGTSAGDGQPRTDLLPDSTAPDGTTPIDVDGPTPDGTTPDGTTPDGTTPDGTTPDGTTPDGTTPDGATPDGTTPDGATPDGATPPADADATPPANGSSNPRTGELFDGDRPLSFSEWDAKYNSGSDTPVNQRKGEFGELHSQQYMENQGWTRIDDGADGSHDTNANGVDGIYSHPGDDGKTAYAVIEAKYNAAGMGNTADGRQMGHSWIHGDATGRSRIEAALINNPGASDAIRALPRNELQSGVVRVTPDGDVRVSQLDNKGYVVRGTGSHFEGSSPAAGGTEPHAPRSVASTADGSPTGPAGAGRPEGVAPSGTDVDAGSSTDAGAGNATDGASGLGGADSNGADSNGADSGNTSTDAENAPIANTGDALTSERLDELAQQGYHVAFFDSRAYDSYYEPVNHPDPTMGAAGSKFWVMPLEDGAHVSSVADAYRATGASPAMTRAHAGYEVDATGNPNLTNPVPTSERGLHALVFEPDAGNMPVKPTTADANGWPHFLESDDPNAGHTAVLMGDGPGAGYLVNERIREYVTDGGTLVGPGSVIVRIEDGNWIAERVF